MSERDFIKKNLHPIATQKFTQEDFKDEIDTDLRRILLTFLDGTVTLRDLGKKHGQTTLDLVGAMHKKGVVEFV